MHPAQRGPYWLCDGITAYMDNYLFRLFSPLIKSISKLSPIQYLIQQNLRTLILFQCSRFVSLSVLVERWGSNNIAKFSYLNFWNSFFSWLFLNRVLFSQSPFSISRFFFVGEASQHSTLCKASQEPWHLVFKLWFWHITVITFFSFLLV